jgi:hypothetical protein
MAYGDYGKTTELEAVNICLGVIGEQPVSAIGEGVSKSTIARDVIYELSREIQTKQLACNTEYEYKLEPDVNDLIGLPATAIVVDPSYLSDNRYVERNGSLYDREDNTYDIFKDVYVDITYFLTWDNLPEHVRRYVSIRAARVFQKRYLADETLHRYTSDDELQAKAEFERNELNTEDFSILDNMRLNPRVYQRKA